MSFNWIIIPTLFTSYLMFGLGYVLAGKLKSRQEIIILFSVACLLAIPGILISLYYLHFFDSWCAFYEFRSVRGTELTASGVGLLGGLIAYLGLKKVRLRCFFVIGVLAVMTLGLGLPYAKPLLFSVNTKEFNDIWDGVVCRQSTGFSCGAACAATIMRHYGIKMTEREMAEECFTYGGGTENWYIARALREKGVTVCFITKMPDTGIPIPCVAGVKIGKIGHFITILEDLGDSYRTGDPLDGERIYLKKDIENNYRFTGFFMKTGKRDK